MLSLLIAAVLNEPCSSKVRKATKTRVSRRLMSWVGHGRSDAAVSAILACRGHGLRLNIQVSYVYTYIRTDPSVCVHVIPSSY